MLSVVPMVHGFLLVCGPPPVPASDVDSELIKPVTTVKMKTL